MLNRNNINLNTAEKRRVVDLVLLLSKINRKVKAKNNRRPKQQEKPSNGWLTILSFIRTGCLSRQPVLSF